MRQALLAKDNPADVINVALEALASNQCELPAYSTLDRMAGALRAQVNGGFHRLVADRLDAAERARLLGRPTKTVGDQLVTANRGARSPEEILVGYASELW
jgi:hypothetical protein